MTEKYIGGLPEMRVNKIFAAIYSGRSDFVLTECDALATTYSQCPFPLVLKGIALQKKGARDESLDLCLKATKMLFLNFGDNVDNCLVVLSNLRDLLCRLGQSEMAMRCYETAVWMVPDKLELMAGLFKCYETEYLYQEQQQITRKMYKLLPGDMFLLWTVCSQVFFANNGDDALPLAERFLKDHVSSTGLVDNKALKVYLFLLEKQHKYGDALEIVKGHSESLFESKHNKFQLQGRFLAKLGRYAAAADAFLQALEQCPDNLEYFLQYLGALLEDDCFYTERIRAKPPQESTKQHKLHFSDEAFDSRMSRAANLVEMLRPQTVHLSSGDNFIEELDSQAIRFSRCCLAQLEIERCKLLFGKGDADEFVKKLVNHFTRFGHWACFIPDIKMFLEVLDKDRKTMLLEKLFLCPDVDSTIIAFAQSICKLKLQDMIDNMGHLPVKDLEGRVLQIVQVFFKGLQLSKHLSPTGQKNHDEILSLAFNILITIFRRTGDIGYMIEATMLMEFGIIIRRDVMKYRCSLVSMYSYWNCHTLAYKCYKSLEIEKILLEPISEKFIPQMLASLPWSDDLGIFLSDCMNFMDNQLVICGDAAYRAFHTRAYLTGMSHMQFKDGLQRSVMYAMLRIETSISKLKQDSYDIDKLEVTLEAEGCGNPCLELAYEMEEKAPVFSEDLKNPHPCIGPTIDETYLLEGFQGASFWQQENADNSSVSFKEHMLKALKQRSLLPRLLYLSTCSAAAAASMDELIRANETASAEELIDKASEEEDEIPDIGRNLKELKTLLDRYAETLGFSFDNAVEHLIKERSDEKLCEELRPNVLPWLTFAVFLNAWNMSSRKIELPSRGSTRVCFWRFVDHLLHTFIYRWIENTKNPSSRPGHFFLSIILLVTEPYSWHGIILQSFAKNLNLERENLTITLKYALLEADLQYSSIRLLCELVMVRKWANNQVFQCRKDQESQHRAELYGMVCPLELEEGEVGPGKISKILNSLALRVRMTNGQDLGFERDDEAVNILKSWRSSDVLKQICDGQVDTWENISLICELKSKKLKNICTRLLQLE